ncbi:hypothetical protein [Ktedonospora formicarum]|uniref:Uncharacterized protein n=1 Tax=Ktedonospora formicarum TaxID=2778364 RepID=A0A8J3MU03_9CHLR|nr:hypothetical protein [Ktedonospora formicarum]GHO46451.1 hypothetical protein KSX_46140 [Ktedonospora formicarum]
MAEPYPSNQVNNLQETFDPPDLDTQVGVGTISPTGVDIQQVNPAIFHVVDKIFAKPLKGLEFLSLILTQAEVKQEALTDATTQTPIAYAVITLQNIRELAHRIHWGYDTTHKYVITFCALNLLFKRRFSNHIELLFPLQHYNLPSSLNELDRLLLKSRPKVQQFARRLRERCVLYNTFAPLINEDPKSGIVSLSPEQELVSQLHSILCAENIEVERRQRLVKRISSEIVSKLLTHPTVQVSSSPKQGRLRATNTQIAPTVVESTFSGRLLPKTKTANEHESTITVDSAPSRVENFVSESTTSVDSIALEIIDRDGNTQKSTDVVDSNPSQDKKQAHEPTTSVDFTPRSLDISEEHFSKSTPLVDSVPSRIESYAPESTSHGRLIQKNIAPGAYESTKHHMVDSPSQAHRTHKKPTSLHDLIKNARTQGAPVDFTPPSELESTSHLELQDPASNQEVASLTTVDSQTCRPAQNLPATVDSKNEANTEIENIITESTTEILNTVDFEGNKAIKLLKDPSAYSREFLALYVTLNVNEFITIIYKNNNNTNVTLRKDLQMFLAEVFEGNRSAWHNHQKLLKTVNAHALASGFVYTLLCLINPSGRTIHNPAGLFTSRCKMFMENKINDRLDEVEHLLQMTCEQICVYLENPYVKAEGLSPFLQKLHQETKANSGAKVKKRGGKSFYREDNFSSTKLYGLEKK